MRSNLFLYGIYLFLKGIVKIMLRAYYPQTRVIHPERLKLTAPTLLATNHPNTLIDALNAAGRVDRQVFFLVNAGLFRQRFSRWFFSTFYCIPVERRQDTNGRRVDNRNTFARVDEHLGKGGQIFIAPEGSSELERHLRPVKTGAARMALSAAQKKDFQLNVRILPIGLNYEQANRFGTRLLVKVGEPILAADFRDLYLEDTQKGVRAMTKALEDRLRSLIIDTRDRREDQLVRYLEQLLRHSAPQPEAAHFRRTKVLIEQLRHWEEDQPPAFQAFRVAVEAYFSDLRHRRLTDSSLAAGHWPGLFNLLGQTLALLAAAPLFLFGALNNALAAGVPLIVNRLLKLYIGYSATVKMMMALLSFPVFYLLQFLLVARLAGSPWSWIYLGSLLPAGYFAWWYAGRFKATLASWRYYLLERRKPEAVKLLVAQRQRLWRKVQELLSAEQTQQS